jgi:hypothetical protein
MIPSFQAARIRSGGVLALPAWEWFRDADSVAEYLVGLAERLEQGLTRVYPRWVAGRARTLARKTLEFDRTYFTACEGFTLGYFIIFREHDILVKALVARGRDRPILKTVNIERWLQRYEQGDA